MYANEKNIQILIGVLKRKGIREVILSPGGTNAPIIQSFQYDNFFSCHSVVDERNSIYYAIGISQVKGCPVVCVCTAGTAVSNFLPGMTEAYYQNIPIIAVTADSSPFLLDQLELQKIKQEYIFEGLVKGKTSLPVVVDDLEEWACNRMVNEMLLELDHHGKGPVHINIPITKTLECSTQKLPFQRLIERTDVRDINYKFLDEKLFHKKVMIIVGQGLNIDEEFTDLCNQVYKRYNCIFSVETISNLNCNGAVSTYVLTETNAIGNDKDVIPDIVISIGNHIASYNLKNILRGYRNNIENWDINESGCIRDPYWSLIQIFEGNAKDFFKRLLKNAPQEEQQQNHSYYKKWDKLYNCAKRNTQVFSSISIARKLVESIPDFSILHTAVLNSTRVVQFSDYLNAHKIKYYSNLGALGIDGVVGTFIGEAAATENLSYLLVGDCSFFYGMNGISIRGVRNNARIILLNNGGGEEFKIKMDYPDMEKYVCAAKKRYARGWAEDCGFQYYLVNDYESLDKVLQLMKRTSDTPVFLEVDINMDVDSKVIRNIYSENRTKVYSTPGNGLKEVVKKALPDKYIDKAQKIYKIIKS